MIMSEKNTAGNCLNDMDNAVNCLYIAVHEDVADDMKLRWQRVREYIVMLERDSAAPPDYEALQQENKVLKARVRMLAAYLLSVNTIVQTTDAEVLKWAEENPE